MRVLDVSALEHPEPLQRILAALPDLGNGDFLRVLHRREPLLLYPMLEQAGYVWSTQPGRDTAFEIRIWRRGDARAETRASEPVAAPS